MSSCPLSADLQRLFTGELDGEATARMDRHVEACHVCQAQLASLTDSADADRWRNLLASAEGEETDSYQITPPRREPRSEPVPEIPGYRIIREIGRGGAATVYLARQVSLNRLVALKILRGGVDPGAVQRFRSEAEAAARLRHPNIVVVHEVGEHAGLFFLALEYFDGGTLAEFAGREPLPPRVAARILEPVARALHHAHQAQVIHRDIKPSNILLQHAEGKRGRTGELSHGDIQAIDPKVCDFGLARQLDESHRLTRTRDLLGTPVYMAPELIADAGAAAPTSDVYAVGVVLYELLTGRPPFFGNSPMDILLQSRDVDPVAPRRLRPDIPFDLQTICLKCLEKEPGRRYASAQELGDELQRFLAGQPIRARPISKLAHAARWARRHKSVAALLTMLMVVVVAGTASAVIAADHFRRTAADMQKLADEKEAERQKTDEQRERTLQTLYFTRANLAGQSLAAIDSGQQVELFLREWRGLKARLDPRGWEWYYFNAIHRQAALTLHGHELDVMALAWSSDGRRLASAGFGRALHVWDAESGRQLSMTKAGWGITAIQWSRDGRRILTLGADQLVHEHDGATGEQIRQLLPDRKVRTTSNDGRKFVGFAGNVIAIWNDRGEVESEFAGHTEPPLVVAWSPADQFVASCERGGRLLLWQPGRQSPDRAIATGHEIVALRWSHDGQRIACAHSSAKISLWDVATGRLLREFSLGSTSFAKCLDFSPDGKTLAAGMIDSKVKLWDVATGRETSSLSEHQFVVHSVAFHPDGHWLASGNGGWNGQIKLWKISDIVNSGDFAAVAEKDCQAFWDATGRYLVVGDTSGHRILDGQDGRVLRAITGSVMRGSIATADGRQFIGRDDRQALTIWDLDGSARRLPAEFDDGQARRIATSPDGRYVATISWRDSKPDRFRLRVWNLQTGKCVCDRSGNGGSWSPDGRWFAVGDVYNIQLLDTDRFEVVSNWASPESGNDPLFFHPKSSQLACVYRNNVVVRSVSTGVVLFQLVGHNDFVSSVKWLSDGSRIATGSHDGTVRVWDGKSGQLIATLRGHTGPVYSVAWSPDGRRLISAGSGMVRHWDARRGFELEKFSEPIPSGSPPPPELQATFASSGWWVIDGDEWDPAGPDPFMHKKIQPRWFAPSSDPNGFLPLANSEVVYLRRVFAGKTARVAIRRTGEIATRLWWNGTLLDNAPRHEVSLSPGWHTFVIQISDPVRQMEQTARPNAGLYFRLDSE
ncbi:MAG: serine/threonine protein kinase [Gemmataceae bacterium]|nr:serine/threonine protein kinase [Gemmataceae bacterium]